MVKTNGDVYRSNDYEFEFYVGKRKAASGLPEAAASLSTLYGWISKTDSGDEHHADLKVLATERADKPGWYYGTISGGDITDFLFSGVGAVADEDPVFIVFGNGTRNIRISIARVAYTSRPAGLK
jgi:hypothetical protein